MQPGPPTGRPETRFVETVKGFVGSISAFVTGERVSIRTNRMLATVLFRT